MASYTKTSKGWRAAVAVRGTRDTKTFTTKAAAVAWAASRETQIRSGENAPPATLKTLDDAFERYLAEVSIHKRGHRMEGTGWRPSPITWSPAGDLAAGL